ncbi:hypothetical protein TNCV_2187631 [Trichonephila clavipes]|nr:hypothetical protein TNCV_2187631 [Trichonephila clavipes]
MFAPEITEQRSPLSSSGPQTSLGLLNARKISQRLPGLESLHEKKCVVSYEILLKINETKYSTFQEAARTAGLSKADDFMNEMLDDADSVMSLIEEECQERILRKKNK